ncbi:MAG: hypothetical protein JOZ81_29360 [Chloroflexi bacterium]|nr:hypothetical protein [Chloroflexota bacterium]MBV9543344.1 hypothetical protein [Chloroflexota bacterium]
MSTNDEADHRTIQDDRAELGELGMGSPVDEGEGEDVSLDDEFETDAPEAVPPAMLGGAPAPTAADVAPERDRLI